jgi:hypothetical protein
MSKEELKSYARVTLDWAINQVLENSTLVMGRDDVLEDMGVIRIEQLQDPVTVHVNMLRGGIAKPSITNIIHLYGAEALTAALMEKQNEN